MATEVSSLARILNDYYSSKKLDDHKSMKEIGKSASCLITRDFLGGSNTTDDSQELDLDLQVPNGWEKRLDLKSGKVYIQRNDSPNSLSSSKNSSKNKITKIQDFNFSPSSLLSSSTSSSSSKISLNLFDKTSLDLKLVTTQSPCNYQSVCTLDKVKFALERADRDKSSKKRSSLSCSSPSPSNSSSSIKENEEHGKKTFVSQNGQLFAAGCPNCLLYVMISKNNPRSSMQFECSVACVEEDED